MPGGDVLVADRVALGERVARARAKRSSRVVGVLSVGRRERAPSPRRSPSPRAAPRRAAHGGRHRRAGAATRRGEARATGPGGPRAARCRPRRRRAARAGTPSRRSPRGSAPSRAAPAWRSSSRSMTAAPRRISFQPSRYVPGCDPCSTRSSCLEAAEQAVDGRAGLLQQLRQTPRGRLALLGELLEQEDRLRERTHRVVADLGLPSLCRAHRRRLYPSIPHPRHDVRMMVRSPGLDGNDLR